ncbi:uncharacterized protein [Physcomitrium patens]|uniref:Uncharacterized protein n=1 Tax=Physcomitrium patens TaxID=3218 RepID=A0A7I4CFZ3_PHYPA|nr:uncharacterized protein LOC112274818 isoform X1 [Physcomitrium patens]|eukprot:XP_024360356.1 uncharacterized protein LOC112274818 isoform X1 [Physcomitrella patens]
MKIFGQVNQMKLFNCWMSGISQEQEAIQCTENAVLTRFINQAASTSRCTLMLQSPSIFRISPQEETTNLKPAENCSHFSAQLELNEKVEKERASRAVKLLQEGILFPEDQEDDYTTGLKHHRPSSPLGYTLDIDYTAVKVVEAVIDKCKLLNCVSTLCRKQCTEFSTTLKSLHDILLVIQGSACLDKYKELLEGVLLHASKAYAFTEKVFFQAMTNSLHGVTGQKAHFKFGDFACRFYNLKVELCEQFQRSENDCQSGGCPREKRLSYGVSTYSVPVLNIARRLYKEKRVVTPITEIYGKSLYTVELTYPRTWLSDDVGVVSRVESSERGYKQVLLADRVKIEKGAWGWEAAHNTVLITYNDFLVANVASMAGSLLRFNKKCVKSNKRAHQAQKYRTSVQVVGSTRIDLDLQNLFIKGTKDRDNVYYKCFINTDEEEILAIYRYHIHHFHMAEGLLHIVGRGNQIELRHVLVSIFSCLGFTCTV